MGTALKDRGSDRKNRLETAFLGPLAASPTQGRRTLLGALLDLGNEPMVGLESAPDAG